jgi:hypothetical protein
MADPAITPGVTAPPAEPAAPVTEPPASAPSEPTGTEPVTKTGEPEQTVPFSRFQEVNDKAKQAEEEAQQLRDELAASKTPTDEVDIEEDTEKLLDAYAKKRGLVSQEELAAERSKIQVQQDVNDLTANPPNPGIPFDGKAVTEYANANNLPITSKAAYRAAYREMNYDKIVEVERQKAIEGYKTAGASGAELPGSTGTVVPTEPELTAKTPKERTRERIRNAHQKLTV